MASRLADLRAELFDGGEHCAEELLGRSHPLPRLLAARAAVVRQALVVLAALACSTVGALAGVRIGMDAAVAASVVEVVLGIVLAWLLQLERVHTRSLIVEGLGYLPIGCVAAERQRLQDPRVRRRLARSLERTLDTVDNWERIAIASRPPAAAVRLREAMPELRELVDQLRDPTAGIRGVALAADLLAGGYASPLYEGRIAELRLELARIRYLLAAPASAGPRVADTPAGEHLP